MVTFANYLNIQDFYFNELIGDVGLATLIGNIFVTYACIKLQMPYQLIVLFNALWLAIVFSAYTGMVEIWISLVLFAAVLFYYKMGKVIGQ